MISHDSKTREVWFAIDTVLKKARVGTLSRRFIGQTPYAGHPRDRSEVETTTSEYKILHSGLDKYPILGILHKIIL